MKAKVMPKGKKPDRWQVLAEFEAEDAYERNFQSRRGVHGYVTGETLCIYNNNPYANFPALRDEEIALFRDWLRENGIPELAFATYPKKGESAGYTTAMIIEAGDDRLGEVADELERIVRLSGERMNAASK